MTVMHISGARSWGGNEQQLMYLVDQLLKYGVNQMFFCFKDTPLSEKLKNKPVGLIAVEYAKPRSAKFRKLLARAVKQNDVDILHLHTSDSVTGFVLTDIFENLDKPTIYARKSVRRKNSLLSKLKYNYPGIDRVICISKYVEKDFRSLLKSSFQKKTVVIRNGVTIEGNYREAGFRIRKKYAIPENNLLIGNIANHTKAKDLKTLIRAIAHLRNDLGFEKFHLIQIGEFSKRTSSYQKEVEDLGMENFVTFTDFQEKASRFLPQFDVFVMSSEREGGPSSIIEAFYHKVPVVSTRVGIVEEIIQDGINGFSAEVGDFEKLARGIKAMADDQQLREDFKDKNYQIYQENFTAERLGKDTYNLYKEVVQNYPHS